MEELQVIDNFQLVQENGQNILIDGDSARLRNILPSEIWQLITNRLTNLPDDLTSLSNSSPFFRNLLLHNRSLFLFENVFKTLAPTIWKIEGEYEFSLSNVLNCRGVCSQWNISVDKLLQQKFSHAELSYHLNTLLKHKSTIEFCTSRNHQVSRFLRHFEATHCKPEVTRNPFIWKNLLVSTTNGPYEQTIHASDQRYLNAISSVVQKYGHFIENFKLEIQGRTLYIEDALKLKDWLVHMPNLKSIIIIDETKSFERDLTLNEFQAELKHNQNFQQFPKLKLLETVNFEHVRSPIFNQFIRHNYHIPSLNLSKCDDEYNFFNLPFPNLTKFILEIDSVEMFERLRSSLDIPWTKLYYISIIFADKTKFVHLSKILKVLQRKFSSLESLYLQMPKAKSKEDTRKLWKHSVNCRLNLPSLTGVHLSLRDPTSLVFLLPMKNILEELSLEVRYPTVKIASELDSEAGSETVVQLNGFENNILDSNIPLIFTKLEEIGVFGNEVDEEKWYYL